MHTPHIPFPPILFGTAQINAVDDFPDVPELYKDPFAFPPAYEYPTASLNALGALAGSQLATQFAQQVCLSECTHTVWGLI